MPTPRREQEGVHLPMADTDTLAPNRRDKGGSPGLLHAVGDFGQQHPEWYGSPKSPALASRVSRGVVPKNPPTSDQRC